MPDLTDLAAASIQITCPSCLTVNRAPVGGAADGRKCDRCGAKLLEGPPAKLDTHCVAAHS